MESNKVELLELMNHYIDAPFINARQSAKNIVCPEAFNNISGAVEIKKFLETESEAFGNHCKRGHITASAWIVNEKMTHALFTHHKKLDKWLQLGGHTEEGEFIREAAVREAQEESGIRLFEFIMPDIFDVDVHQIPARQDLPEHFHYDIRFFLRTVNSDSICISDESNDLAWIAWQDIESYTTEDSIIRMKNKAICLLSNLPKSL